MKDNIYKFWRDHSLTNIKPNTGEEYPEGWDVVEYFKNFMTPKEYGDTIEVGCGYGRLCKAFNPDNYLGLDISPNAIIKLLYTVLLHQCDEDIKNMIESLCITSRRIIVAEICGRDWRRKGNPPVFNRTPEEYDAIFREYDRGLSAIIKKPYERYKKKSKSDTDLSIMVFED